MRLTVKFGGKRRQIVLRHDSDAYRWYTSSGEDLEVSGRTRCSAYKAITASYPDSDQWTEKSTTKLRTALRKCGR